jgi:hypothetical protein
VSADGTLTAVTSASTPPTWTAGSGQPVLDEMTAVAWADGTTECRYRLLHPAGSLVADDGDVGLVLTDADAVCTTCTEACG